MITFAREALYKKTFVYFLYDVAMKFFSFFQEEIKNIF